MERSKADSRNEVLELDTSVHGMQEEIKQMKKQRRRDCYSLVQEELSHNPFMTKILKSSEFSPSAGVKHTDNIELANSPSIDGGQFKSLQPNIMSRAEFELRTSLTVLKQFGPEKTDRNRRNNRVTQSMEIRPQRTGFSSAGVSFSQLTDSRAGTAR